MADTISSPDARAAAQAQDSLTPWQVMAAGMSALILTVGLARFAYTPLLPVMLAETGLDAAGGGWLATLNYAGYMLGTAAAVALHDPVWRYRSYRLCLVLALVGTGGMGLAENFTLWAVLRFFAGIGSVGGLLLGSGLVLGWLLARGRRPELGVHFVGMGMGITVSGLAAVLMAGRLDWAMQWWVFGLVGALLLLPSWFWMPRPVAAAQAAHAAKAGGPRGRSWLLPAAYFCASVGYVIGATFLVAIVAAQPGLSGGGNLAWLLVGVASTPAVVLWDRLARRVGDVGALQLAYAIQIVSFLLLFGGGLGSALAAALLYGFTSIGIVGLTLAYAGRQAPDNPGRAMARLTLSYGVGQTVAPAIAGYIAQSTGGYAGALWLAAAAMLVGMVFLGMMQLEARRLRG